MYRKSTGHNFGNNRIARLWPGSAPSHDPGRWLLVGNNLIGYRLE
jgi:hypothetical protein